MRRHSYRVTNHRELWLLADVVKLAPKIIQILHVLENLRMRPVDLVKLWLDDKPLRLLKFPAERQRTIALWTIEPMPWMTERLLSRLGR